MKEQINCSIHNLWTLQISLAFPKSDRLSPTEREMKHVVITGSSRDVKTKSKAETLLYSSAQSFFSVKLLHM